MRMGERVFGFESVDLSYTMDDSRDKRRNCFNGLQRAREPGYLMHNYDPKDPDRHWYALGCPYFRAQYSGYRPGWPGANGDWEESWVELYAMPPSARQDPPQA
uniref:Uncharacterized protein n=1 Tax=Alexandrium catenella TaxID=2925 RepID=A0A7S1S7D9_ALECA